MSHTTAIKVLRSIDLKLALNYIGSLSFIHYMYIMARIETLTKNALPKISGMPLEKGSP